MNQIVRRFLLGAAQGLGFCLVLGVFGVIFLITQPEYRAKIVGKLNPEKMYGDKVDLAAHVPAKVLVNPNVENIRGKAQINVPEHFDKQFIDSSERLYADVSAAKPNTAFILMKGVYHLKKTLRIKADNVWLLSETGDPLDVIINGKGMRRSHKVENLIEIQAPGAVIDGLTLQKAGNHLIQLRAESNSDFPIIRNCILRDGYEQLIKVSYDKRNKADTYSDSGLVENCLFEYTAGIGPNYYIGGIDAHGIKNWIIKNNVFKNIASPGNRIAEHAIHLWNNTENNLVESNIIIDSDRGIGFGMHKKTRNNENRNIKFSNFGGIIRNNVIYHADNGHPFADTGIVLENSPRTVVQDNYIFLEHDYRRAIEYRFPQTEEVVIKRNFVNKRISSRDGGTALLIDNEENLSKSDFLLQFIELTSNLNIEVEF